MKKKLLNLNLFNKHIINYLFGKEDDGVTFS